MSRAGRWRCLPMTLWLFAACARPPCQSDADCPPDAPICFLSECGGTEPPFFGDLNQPCRAGGICDEGLRCVEDDNDADTRPNCRSSCPPTDGSDVTCPSGFSCLEVPTSPGEGACVPQGA